MELNGKTPSGPIAEQWARTKDELRLVSPTGKRKFEIKIDAKVP